MVFTWLPCGVYSEFVQQRIQDASMALFTAIHSTVGFSFVHSIIQLSLLLSLKLIFCYMGYGYVRSNHLSGTIKSL